MNRLKQRKESINSERDKYKMVSFHFQEAKMGGENNHRQKKRKPNPETEFRSQLSHFTRTKNLSSAITLYNNNNNSSSTQTLTLTNLNTFLHICTDSLSNPETRPTAIQFGFNIFKQNDKLKPNEATLTAVARLAAANGDGDYAFQLAKSVESPKLRSFAPALVCFCENGMAEKAFEVEECVVNAGLVLEETELAALFKVSVVTGREEKVYEYLHKLRRALGGVNESTMEIIESWFKGDKAGEVGVVDVSQDKVKEAIMANGGGWHGLGWLGKGEWIFQRTNIAANGSCCACGHQLVCPDIGNAETDKFVQSIASLAFERETQSNFKEFQDWLEQHSQYESVVDGANIGLFQQNFVEGGFSMSQLEAVVKQVHNRNKKWPLVVLHSKRVRSLLEDASKRALIQEWIDEGVLYGTPYGSNDDWYWLYAAIKLKCLLVTNDEMRDHIFELIGSDFFARWKERHQVRYTFLKSNPQFVMPPSYSIVIQESEKGSWHVPLAGEVSDDRSRSWLCVTRSGSSDTPDISAKNPQVKIIY